MANNEQSTKKVTKKEARKLVYDRLAVALAEFKTGIKDKKFESKLLRASKLFATDIARAASKLNGKAKAGKKEKTPKVDAQQLMKPAVA